MAKGHCEQIRSSGDSSALWRSKGANAESGVPASAWADCAARSWGVEVRCHGNGVSSQLVSAKRPSEISCTGGLASIPLARRTTRTSGAASRRKNERTAPGISARMVGSRSPSTIALKTSETLTVRRRLRPLESMSGPLIGPPARRKLDEPADVRRPGRA